MLKFNNEHIFTGYIKQLLASFNLPKYRIYSEDVPVIKTKKRSDGDCKYCENNKPHLHVGSNYFEDMNYAEYIKDNKIQCYVEDTTVPGTYHWEVCGGDYVEGIKIPNRTKTLIIKNSIYDTYTHEYLGDYLRFKRDYCGLDLMQMYNCFSNRICNQLKIVDHAANFSFDAADEAYKIYMLPVKLFQRYTIAIDSASGVEICCGLYDSYQDKREKVASLPHMTYQRFAKTLFHQPILYTKLNELSMDEIVSMELAQDEEALHMFIKVPANNTSSIVVLEGDYRSYNDNMLVWQAELKMPTKKVNRSVLNMSAAKNYDKLKAISPLQLLKLNTGTSYPFSQRLVEYLIGNAITCEETIGDNVLRVQKVIGENEKSNVNNYFYGQYPGLWTPDLRAKLYEYMTTSRYATDSTINYDMLGYVDKDVEKLYSSANNSISNVDLYAGLHCVSRGGKK